MAATRKSTGTATARRPRTTAAKSSGTATLTAPPPAPATTAQAPAKTKPAPRPRAKSNGASATLAQPSVSHEQIAQRAFEIWIERGRPIGCDSENWLEAERQLKSTSSN